MEQLRVEILASDELSPQLWDEILQWLVSEFIDEDDQTVWSSVDWHILGWLDDLLVGHTDILRRIVQVGDSSISAGGVGGVVTKPAWRGRGIGSRLMREAHQFMRNKKGVDFGLLMCDEAVVPFYKSLGWQLVDNPLTYDQP